MTSKKSGQEADQEALKSDDVWYHIQKRLQEMPASSDIYAYQLPHLSLDKHTSLQAVETYLNELENVQQSYKTMSKIEMDTTTTPTSTTLATCKQSIKLQNHIIFHTLSNDLARWKKQVEDLKNLIHNNLSPFEETDSTAYDKIKAALDRLNPTAMDECLADIQKNLQAREDAALDYTFEESGFVFNIEEVITTLENAVENKQIDDIQSAYDLALKHLLYMHPTSDISHNVPTLPSYDKIDQLIAQMSAASPSHAHTSHSE